MKDPTVHLNVHSTGCWELVKAEKGSENKVFESFREIQSYYAVLGVCFSKARAFKAERLDCVLMIFCNTTKVCFWDGVPSSVEWNEELQMRPSVAPFVCHA